MSTTAVSPALPADPASALRRLLLGPKLSPGGRALVRRMLKRVPARTRAADRPQRSARRWLRRIVVLLPVLIATLGLNLIVAPSAHAFDIFGPVKHAVVAAFNGFLDRLAQAVCGFVGNFVHGILGYTDRGPGIDFNVAWFKTNYEHKMLGGFLMGLAVLIVLCTAAAPRRNPTQMLTAVAATLLGVLTSFVAR